MTGQKQFSARETLVFIRLVRWGLQSLDIYTLSAPRSPAQPPAQPHVRSKEEKEVLEHFSGVVSLLRTVRQTYVLIGPKFYCLFLFFFSFQ